MTLRIYADLEQGSDEWLEVRRGVLTASTVGQLITPKTIKVASNDTSRALTMQLVAEHITGWVEEQYVSADMWRGKLDEPIARDLYSKHYAPVTECGFMIRHEGAWALGYSPDGLVGDDGLIEIKSPRPKEHVRTVLADEVPVQYMAQCQAGLLVSGREWLDYISFASGMPLWRKRVTPDERWQAAIVEAATSFEEAATDMTSRYYRAVAGLPATERIEHDIEVMI